jgi:adenylate cyclase class 2
MQLADVTELESKLRDVGAERGPVLAEINTFFDTPTGSLKAGDQGLRVRQERDEKSGKERITITHKGPRAHGKLKQRTETELEVSDARIAAALLSALGFVRVLSFEKRRRRWELDDCHVELDTLPHLGHFVEIEGPDDATIMAVREKLGLSQLPMIRASYIAMLQTHLAERHLKVEHVALES